MWDVQSVYFRACATACLLAGTAVHAQAPLVPGRLPTLPLTQLDDRTLSSDLDNRVFTLTFAQPVAIPDLLLLLVRETSLSVVPDPGISGTFIGELKNVVHDRVHRQVQIDARVIEVELNAPNTQSLDWELLAQNSAQTAAAPGSGSW